MVDVAQLQALARDELIRRARAAGVDNPEAMTRPELVDEIVRRTEQDAGRRRAARGWFGVARDLLASMVEQGLNLPDAAALIRGDANFSVRVRQPLSTVTLAEIYAAQGHLGRALKMLDEVLALEPEHLVARSLRERIAAEKVGRGLPTEPPPGVELELPVIPMSPPVRDVAHLDDAPAAPAPGDDAPANDALAADAPAEAPPAADAPAEAPSAGDAPAEATPAADAPAEATPAADAPAEATPAADAGVASAAPVASAAFWALRGGSFCVFWELDAARRADAASALPGGHLAIVVLLASPGPGGARVTSREIAVTESAGVVRLDAPRLDVVGRAALGWRRGSEMVPLVVGLSLDAPAPSVAVERARARARAAMGAVA